MGWAALCNQYCFLIFWTDATLASLSGTMLKVERFVTPL